MTENKRFTEIVSLETIKDNETEIEYRHCLVTDDFLELVNNLAEENEQLKSRVDYLERKIQRERASAMKQHEKWENEIQKENEQLKSDYDLLKIQDDARKQHQKELMKENEQLKSTIKEVTELLVEEVDVFSEKATEHDINAYLELKELDNKDAFYMAIATKEAIKMLKEVMMND